MDNFYIFSVPALNSEKLLNNLLKKYNIYDIKKNNNLITFKCEIKHKQKIKKYLTENKIEIKAEKFTTFSDNLFAIKRLGIIIAICFCLLLWGLSTLFVFKVNIYTNNVVLNDSILQILKESGFKNCALKSKINCKKIENKIVEKCNLLSVSVIIKGNTLVVNVEDKLNNSEYVNVDGFTPIVSLYDGKLSTFNLIQGTSSFAQGDIVKLGDILVEPYIIDSVGNKKNIQPLAEIVCDAWFTTRINVPDNEIVTVKTGKKVTNVCLYAFGLKIYDNNQINCFKNYEKMVKEIYVTDIVLPIKKITTTFYEVETIERKNDFEKNLEKYVNKCREMILLNVKECDIIINESKNVSKRDGMNTLVYVATVRKKIA